MTIVFVHGFPETREIWTPLRNLMNQRSVAIALPGFAASRPKGFTGTKDAYAEWLADELKAVQGPIDLVGHDVGALLTARASAFDVPVRSWIIDVPDILHPRFEWPERVRKLQIPGVGEEMLRRVREAPAEDPESQASRLMGAGVPRELAEVLGSAHDEVMSRCILEFYRSAVPNVAATWWKDIAGARRSRGLVLLLPDPPEIEAMSLEVAQHLGAETVRLGDLNHCWMAEAPEFVAPIVSRFWSSLR